MVPPSEPGLPVDLDLAVVDSMARTARDLTLLLDVMAGPDPLTLGVAHRLALPPARHERLGDDGGARVARHSPLLPDLTEAATLYTQLLISVVPQPWQREN